MKEKFLQQYQLKATLRLLNKNLLKLRRLTIFLVDSSL